MTGDDSDTWDVIVVGGGVIGLAITRELGQRGLSTVCVGQPFDTPGTASSAAGAMLGALGEVTAAATSPQDRDETQLRMLAAERYPAFLASVTSGSGRPVAVGHGTIVVANLVNEDDRTNLRAIAETA